MLNETIFIEKNKKILYGEKYDKLVTRNKNMNIIV